MGLGLGVQDPISVQLAGDKNSFNVHQVGMEADATKNRKNAAANWETEAAWGKPGHTK